MTYATDYDLAAYNRRRSSRKSFSQDLIFTCALLFGALVGTWLLYTHFVATVETAATTSPVLTFAERFPAQEHSLIPYSPLINPRVSYGPAVAFSQSAPLAADFVSAAVAPVSASMQIAQQDTDPSRVAEVPAPPAPVIPMPRARPVELALLTDQAPTHSGLTTADKDAAPQAQPTPAQAKIASATAAAEKRSVIQKLLGIGGKSPAETALAYAASDGGITDAQSGHSLPYDRWTAVYDISARTVYLPDGRKLEAHSGLGSKLDDPRYVNVHNLGATPPNVYDLKLREASFHGVRALRLTPTGDGETFNRAGLLAHSYMLGPRGDSNGCVSFRDYDAFLRAFENGEVKRLVVVSKLS